MEVGRIDIYNFKLTLTESEFAEVKALAELQNMSIEEVLSALFDDSLDYMTNV